jgi:hypothetical protein
MIKRFYNSVRPILGGCALAIGCFGFIAFVFLIPLALLSANLWTGFTPDGPGMAAAERYTAISEALAADARYRLAPLFVGSLLLIGYGVYEAYMEQRNKSRDGAY